MRMPLNLDRVKVGHQSCKHYSPLTPRYDKNVAPPVLGYLSNRPQVSMGYRLINHAGFWKNTRRIVNHEPQASDLRILRVFYQHPKWFISL